MRIAGDDLKGIEIFTNEDMASEFAKTMRSRGYRARKVVKCERFLGHRMPVNPPSIKVYYNIMGDSE